MSRRLFALLIIVLALVVGVGAVSAQAVSLTASEVYRLVSPSVVAINVYSTPVATVPRSNQTPQQVIPEASSGSGFVIDQQGHIVTNAHVVEGANRIEVNFVDGTKVKATIVGLDVSSDLAVIKVDLPADRLTPIAWGNSDTLAIGQDVLAIGSPFGQRWTLTSGIISALDRTISGLTQFSIGGVIQTDAAINPGNSGGPLLDMNGRVIGVNSQIRSNTGSFDGIGYAIPINLTQRVAQDLIANGKVEYSYLGIRGSDISLTLIEALRLPNNFEGIVVSDVVADSPAGRAGLRNASNPTTIDGLTVPQSVDIITAINNTPMTSMSDLIGYLAKYTKPGDTATLTVLRNGTETLTLQLNLTARPSN